MVQPVGHPLNADRLHTYLSQLDLPIREQEWTVPLAKEDPDDQTEGVVGPFLYWADAAAGKASEEQSRLAAQVLLWPPFQSFESYLRIDHEQRRWVILHTHLNFDEGLGFGVERSTSAQMSQWIDVRAFLIPKAVLPTRLKLLRSVDFWGDGCAIPKASQCWVSEYPWHSSFQDVDEYCFNNTTWFRGLNDKGFYLPVCEISDDDRSVLLPAPSLHKDLGATLRHPLSAPTLTASGFMEILDQSGRCVVKASAQQRAVLMIDAAVLMQYLTARSLVLVWAVLSEKSAWNGSMHVGGLANQSAVYVLEVDGRISGGHTVGHKESPEK